MNSEQKMNTGVKIASAVLLVAVVTAAGAGLLVQHRKLREQRQAREHLEHANQQLVASRDEHVSANKELAGELYKLRDAERARAANAKKERAAWTKERAALSNRVAAAFADVKKARAAQGRAEKDVARLKAQVKDLTAANKKLRAEREKFRTKCNSLERKPDVKKPPTPQPTSPSVAPPSAVPPSVPSPGRRTPEAQKQELDDLLNIR